MGVRTGQQLPLRRVLSFVHHVGKMEVCPSRGRIEAAFGAFGAMPIYVLLILVRPAL